MSEDECALSWLSWILLPPEQKLTYLSRPVAESHVEQQAALELYHRVPSWLRDPLMWCYGLPEDMAGFPRPTN
ncbi:TPA: hypothetical protein ACH3X1_004045 [Trebouxia sp. C0004]